VNEGIIFYYAQSMKTDDIERRKTVKKTKRIAWACHVCQRECSCSRLCSPSVLLLVDFVFCVYKGEDFLLLS
jgi:hypothetical protein